MRYYCLSFDNCGWSEWLTEDPVICPVCGDVCLGWEKRPDWLLDAGSANADPVEEHSEQDPHD